MSKNRKSSEVKSWDIFYFDPERFINWLCGWINATAFAVTIVAIMIPISIVAYWYLTTVASVAHDIANH